MSKQKGDESAFGVAAGSGSPFDALWRAFDGGTATECPPYSVERHGNGWAIYCGRTPGLHGLNLAHLTECDEEFAQTIAKALNRFHQNNPVTDAEPSTPANTRAQSPRSV